MGNRENLAKLLIENPDLPVLCMVESEIVAGDDFARWAASLGECRVREYLYQENRFGDTEIFWREDAEKLVDAMAEDAETRINTPCEKDFVQPDPAMQAAYEQETREMAYKAAREEAWAKVNEMPWQKAIIVNIDLPEVPA